MIINVVFVYFGVFKMGCVCTYSMLNRTRSVARVPLELSNRPVVASQELGLCSYQVSELFYMSSAALSETYFYPLLLVVSLLQIIVLVPRERDVCILSLESFLHSCSTACSVIGKSSCQGLLNLNILCVFNEEKNPEALYPSSMHQALSKWNDKGKLQIPFIWWMKLRAERKVLEGKSAGSQVGRSESGT